MMDLNSSVCLCAFYAILTAVCWLSYQLITGYNTQDATITSLLTTFDWYIVPVANPDGYEYSHTTGVGSTDWHLV